MKNKKTTKAENPQRDFQEITQNIAHEANQEDSQAAMKNPNQGEDKLRDQSTPGKVGPVSESGRNIGS